jgi:predicted ATPase/signal transduction histidine kinase
MLTGSLPFTASDPMEWVHCHIARKPVPPSERLEKIPAPVSHIIMKLLAKTAEERYQTAAGLEADLRKCLAEWELHGRIEPFALGEHDTPDRLLIPEKLYGRAREVDTLLASFDRIVKSGKPEFVLVSGYSGIGKSSVVHELHKMLVPPRGLFASGKFDQYKRDIPYATLAQAFQSLVQPLLGKSDAELASWRDALREALGPNGALLFDLVPELKLIIGEQSSVPDLPSHDAQRRFHLVFRRFINVFARPEHPLALFLDDLQWLDAATLDLLEDLFIQRDVQHLLLIGAYRNNEVNSSHPLMRKLEAIRATGAMVQEITLAPLADEDVRQLIADALHCEPGNVAPLAQLVHEKTAGNPFFVIQFLNTLADERLLTLEHGQSRWSWDLNRIHAKGFTDNVVDLIVGKLNRLPIRTLKALQEFACLGNTAEASTLSIVRGTSEEEVHSDLWEAVRLELIVRLERGYRFVHDRVQEAAYSLISEVSRTQAHLRIGNLLRAHTPPEKHDEALFDIVNQLNRGAGLICLPEERERLAELNLMAGKRAKACTAYESALTYLGSGRGLLDERSWERHYRLTFELELLRAECEILTGALTFAENRLLALAEHATNQIDRAAATRACLSLYITVDRLDRAVVLGLEYLRHVGIEWSPQPSEEDVRQELERMWRLLDGRSIEQLLNLPLMSDPDCRATMDVLCEMLPPAGFFAPNLLELCLLRMVNLSLEHGNCDASCFAYCSINAVLGFHLNDYQMGFRFGQLSYDLVEKQGLNGFEARTLMHFGAMAIPWVSHLSICRPMLRRAFDTALETGDLHVAICCGSHLTTNLLDSGESLANVEQEIEAQVDFLRRSKSEIDTIMGQRALVRVLLGKTPEFGSFDDGTFEECRFERRLEQIPYGGTAVCRYWIRKLQGRFMSGDYVAAAEAGSRAGKLIWSWPSFFEEVDYHFFDALALVRICETASAGERAGYLDVIVAHHNKLIIWAENCPENFENRAALVSAEIARIEGREIEAERLYEQAIHSAHTNGFVQNEALANELAARFYAARGFKKIAHAYLQDARYGYLRWGADGKVRQLDQLYPQLREPEPVPGPTSTIGASVEQLDLATVIKVSQAVSGEIVLEKLIDTLMRTAIEHAGAERGLLILPRGDELRVAAEATSSGDTVIVGPREESMAAAALPESIVHYVMRIQESVILGDASAENPFFADPYVRQHHARSILCLPLTNRAKLIGVLYLENNLTPHVFTPTRIAVLKLLASQAAISLENARLYRDAQQMEAYLKAAQTLSHTGSFGWRPATGEINWSEETYQIMGYDRGTKPTLELVFQRIYPEDIVLVQEAIDRATLNGTDLDFEHRLLLPDGAVKSVYILAHAIKDESGNIEYVGAIMDITARKQAEEALRKSQGELAHIARVMTMGELAASIAHEVNQPLASVVTSASACLRWLDAQKLEEARRSASRAMAEGHRASEIIGRIRALAKKAPPQKDWLDINETIYEVIALARSEIQRNGVALETELSEQVPLILADRIELQQVILNLVMNGIEAMNTVTDRPREMVIRSSAHESDKVLVAVQDSGIGIDSENLDKIFDTFYTTKPQGMGMGLAISRSIVENHGGRLWATVNASRGAVFQCVLPVGSENVA